MCIALNSYSVSGTRHLIRIFGDSGSYVYVRVVVGQEGGAPPGRAPRSLPPYSLPYSNDVYQVPWVNLFSALLTVSCPRPNVYFISPICLRGIERALLAREGEISTGRSTATDLRRELSRVRRAFIMSTSNRSEQQSALLGSRRKGMSSQRRRHPDGDSSTKELIAGGGHDLSRKENSHALQKARVSWDNVFMTKADQSTETTSDHRNSNGLNKSNPRASPPGVSGLDKKVTKNSSFFCWCAPIALSEHKTLCPAVARGFVKVARSSFPHQT